MPAPPSPGIPPEDRRVAGRVLRCPAVRFASGTTVGAPARRSTCHASWRRMDERHNLLDSFERMF
jgi:hypothetical protein